MSNVKAIMDYLETKIGLLGSAPVASKHYYDLNKNDGAKNNNIYAVRPGQASPVKGTTGRATFVQDFEVEFSRDYKESASSDESIREAVESIHLYGEALMGLIVGKPAAPVQNVLPPEISDPTVNQTQKSVSIIYTFPVQYFVSTRSA